MVPENVMKKCIERHTISKIYNVICLDTFSGKKFPLIAKGPGPGRAGLTRGPGLGPAQRSPIVAPDDKTFIQ